MSHVQSHSLKENSSTFGMIPSCYQKERDNKRTSKQSIKINKMMSRSSSEVIDNKE